VQTFGALAQAHPHLHLLVSDGAFRRDGTFVPAPAHDAAVREEAWRRAVLAWFVAQQWLAPEADGARAPLRAQREASVCGPPEGASKTTPTGIGPGHAPPLPRVRRRPRVVGRVPAREIGLVWGVIPGVASGSRA
jgi:hypothetical protein